MNIDDLNQSISEMNDEELYNLLNNIRSSRRKQPEKKVKKQTKTKSKKSPSTKLLETLSKEEKQKLLEELANES